ncbi:MAG: hypothetical protein R2707_01510 [Acidimicrobiales bacterium]
MSRDGDPQQRAEQTIDRIAHAFSPAEWKGRSLVIAIAVFATVAAVTVVQRALFADSTMGWIFTAVHGAIVVVGVPVLSVRAVRDWRAAQADQPSGVPE